ncbi:Hypothetical predicted protein [Pelobates cultripes]|uniref:Uncharacterized protein n=1 Tax=Pelobates cultripes TaxID=61616 RepID=A0AAD1RYH4_PELCU|nr:Hypothetical predicted protein [Pelobates cultripes]
MSPNRTRKATAEVRDKGSFFAAKSQNKHTDSQADSQTKDNTQESVEAGSDQELGPPLLSSPNIPVQVAINKEETQLTTNLMQKMLDAAVNKMQLTVEAAIADLKVNFIDLDARTVHLEGKINEFTVTNAMLGDRLDAIEHRILQHELKLIDVEDRSRRNNIRIRGVPEEIGVQDLESYMRGLFLSIVPDTPSEMLLSDRLHRLARPQHLPISITRDVLIRLHYYHVKDKIMRTHRSKIIIKLG